MHLQLQQQQREEQLSNASRKARGRWMDGRIEGWVGMGMGMGWARRAHEQRGPVVARGCCVVAPSLSRTCQGLSRSLAPFLPSARCLALPLKQASNDTKIDHQSPITNHQSPITNHQAFSSKHTSHTRNTNNTSNTLPHAKLVSRIYGCPISISTQRGSPRWCTEWINRRDSVPS